MICPTGGARRRRLAGGAAWLLGALALTGLGGLWHLDRTRVRDTPGLGAPLELLRPAPADSGVATWLVAVNPECPHCLRTLARLASHPRAGIRVGALVVDTPRRPAGRTIAALPAAPVWWDARGDWRRRWGHRVYGEVLCFDPRGCYEGTRAAE